MNEEKEKQLKVIRGKIGKKIRTRRMSIGMTRKAFAEELELSQASISNIENGKQSLTAEKLWCVALVLRCTPADLLPPVPEEYRGFEKQLQAIEDQEAKMWGAVFAKDYQKKP